MQIKILILACLSFAGCATSEPSKAGLAVKSVYDFYNNHYDRSLSISTSTDGKPQVSYTIQPKATPAALTDAQIAQLVEQFARYSARDGKAVVAR